MKPRERFVLGVIASLAIFSGVAYLFVVVSDSAYQATHGGPPFDWGRVAATVLRGLLVNLFSAFAVAFLLLFFVYGQLADVSEVAARAEARERYIAESATLLPQGRDPATEEEHERAGNGDSRLIGSGSR